MKEVNTFAEYDTVLKILAPLGYTLSITPIEEK